MKLKNHSIFFLVLILFFTACQKKELPIVLPPKGDGVALQVNMGENYEMQYFISLQNQKIVHNSPVKVWDIAFSSLPNNSTILLNGSKLMSAFNTHKINFNDVTINDTTGITNEWKYDEASGNIDSTAIGNWKNNNEIYLIKVENGSRDEIYKLKIISEDFFEYKFEVCELSATIGIPITIQKSFTHNYIYFSLKTNATVENIEPNKNTWDIQFTVYNVTFYDQNPPLPYIVNGVLLNPNGVVAYKDSVSEYNNINVDFANSITMSTNKNVIGYDWKKFDFITNQYVIENKFSYLIKNDNGSLFKLRFLDFYSPEGIKGSPKFEYEQIK